MGDEIAKLSAHDDKIIVVPLGFGIVDVERGLEFDVPVLRRELRDGIAGHYVPEQNCKKNKHMLGPTEKAFNRRKRQPFGFSAQSERRKVDVIAIGPARFDPFIGAPLRFSTFGVVLIGKEAKALKEVLGFVDDVEL